MAILAGLHRYKEQEPPKERKSEGNNWGQCRWTLAVAWAKWITGGYAKGTENLTKIFAPVALKVQQHNDLAALAHQPSIEDQLKMIALFGSQLKDRKEMDWIGHMEVHETKKGEHYLIRFGIHPQSQFLCVAPLLNLSILAAGSGILQGAAPRGPKFYKKKGEKR